MSEALDMQELRGIVDIIFNVDILNNTRKRPFVEARMVFSKILVDRGATLTAVANFLDKDHCTIINYRNNFDIFFSDQSLKKKYIICREAFFQKRPVDKLYLERDKLSMMESKYKRFKNILDIMNEKTPYGKEDILKNKIISFLNGI